MNSAMRDSLDSFQCKVFLNLYEEATDVPWYPVSDKLTDAEVEVALETCLRWLVNASEEHRVLLDFE